MEKIYPDLIKEILFNQSIKLRKIDVFLIINEKSMLFHLILIFLMNCVNIIEFSILRRILRKIKVNVNIYIKMYDIIKVVKIRYNAKLKIRLEITL